MAQKLSRDTMKGLEGLDLLFPEEQVTCACCKYKCPECTTGDIKQYEGVEKIETDVQMCTKPSITDFINEEYVAWLYDDYYDEIEEERNRIFEEERDRIFEEEREEWLRGY